MDEEITNDPSYQKFIEDAAKQCKCIPVSMRPCDGLLAGGLCDELNMSERDEDREDAEEDRDQEFYDNQERHL